MAEQAITQGAIRLEDDSLLHEQILTRSRSIFEPSGFVEHPVLQCVQIKTMEPKAGDSNPVQRFRVVLSDIRNFIQTMIATSTSSRDMRGSRRADCSQPQMTSSPLGS